MNQNNDHSGEDPIQQTETEMLANLLKELPKKILIASDLHLNVGQDPDTGTYSLVENFLADNAFARWLNHYRDHAAKAALLVLNGDIFDFDRVTAIPESDNDFTAWSEYLAQLGVTKSPAELRESVGRVERRYGLRTNDYKTAWKLLRIFSGHAAVFKALAGWISAGGRLIFVKGNHDLELHWPLAKKAIRMELVKNGVGEDQAEQCVAFCADSITIGNIYIEHGQQYEEMTRIEGDPVLPKKSDQINLSLGSFINRYGINHIERLDPFIDNIKPITGALLALLRSRPLSVFKIYFKAWRFVFRALVMRRVFNSAFFLVLAGLIVPVIVLIVLAVCLVFPEVRMVVDGWIPAWLQYGGIIGGLLFPVILPYLIGAAKEIINQLSCLRAKNQLSEQVKKKLDSVFTGFTPGSKVYAAMGHTHERDVLKLAAAPLEKYYVNSGTWVPLWPEHRRDLIGRTKYSFISFASDNNGVYTQHSLQWDDQAEQPREAQILISPFR
jgi:UDP-2,3-diacylglucosamine pyrophosphatase LpxH